MERYEFNEMSLPTLTEDMVVSMVSDDDLRKDFEVVEELEPGLTATWGVYKGEVFCRVREDGLDDLIMACKTLRDAEMTYMERMASPLQQDYAISKGLRLELYARGHDVDAIMYSGDPKAWEPIDYIIETEFPYFKITNRSLLKTKKKKEKKDG